MFETYFHPAFRKDLKKLDRATKEFFRNQVLPKVTRHPSLGLPLTGAFRNLSKFEFHYKGVSYRLIYELNQRHNRLYYLALGPRGEIYKILARRLG